MQPHNCGREGVGFVADQDVASVVEIHPLGTDRRCDHGQAEGHRLAHLALHTCAVSQRHEAHTGTVEDG
jgi:hypothetical protein